MKKTRGDAFRQEILIEVERCLHAMIGGQLMRIAFFFGQSITKKCSTT
jgi:hypothetical protein